VHVCVHVEIPKPRGWSENHPRDPGTNPAQVLRIAPLGTPLPSHYSQLLGDVQTERLDTVAVLPNPRDYALHEEAARATDVEEGSVSFNRRHDRSPKPLPVDRIS
jgi:hypothetical protein